MFDISSIFWKTFNMFYTKASDYAHSTLPTQNTPPSTPNHPHSPIKIVHPPPPTQNISLPPPIHTHPAIKNVHPPPPTQNIPPTPILLESSVQVLKLKSWFLYYIVNEHSTIYSNWVSIPLQTKWLWVESPRSHTFYYSNISPCVHVIVLVFLYSRKYHSISILELLKAQILKTPYWYQKCVEKMLTIFLLFMQNYYKHDMSILTFL